MDWIFEIKDKSGREIHLSRERWKHIIHEHPEVSPYWEELKETLRNPLNIVPYEPDELYYYYKYFKANQPPYLLVIVKYLNGRGFIITAYFTSNIL